jgi:O-antigen ligase
MDIEERLAPVEQINRSKPTLGAYVVGVYLFSVPAFAFSESLGLLIIPQITGLLVVAYAILDILGSQSIKIPREVYIYGFLGLWAFITFIFAVSTGQEETLRLGTLIKVVAATLACAQLIKNETDLRTALKIFVFSILVVSYLNRNELRLLRYAGQITESDRFAGTMTNANFAANFALTVIWASLFVLLKARKKLSRVALYSIPIGISLVIVYYSGSKKGLVGIGLFVLFFTRLLYLRQHSSYRKSLIILISVFLIAITGYFIYTSPFFFRVEEFGRAETDIKRFELAGEAIKVWLMNWKTFIMGVGYENFRLFSRYQTYAHSTPFELLASNGIVGLSLFMGFLVLLFRKFIDLYRHALDQELKSTFFSALIFLSLYSLFMLAEPLHDSRELLPILGCLAAFGQYHLRRLSQSRVNEVSTSDRT